MKLKPLSISDMEPIRKWRNEQLLMLRTSFPLTKEMQEDFYHNVISNRNANARYWGIFEEIETDYVAPPFNSFNPIMNDRLIGMAGIENIQHENRLGEISLLLKSSDMNDYGDEALRLLLHKGFMDLNLDNIYTEVYYCSGFYGQWINNAKEYDCIVAMLPYRKFYNGIYWDSAYINFKREDFLKHENIISIST